MRQHKNQGYFLFTSGCLNLTLHQYQVLQYLTGKAAPEYETNDEPASRPDHGAVLSSNRARQSVPLGHMRYVLAISLALVIAGFIVLYLLLP